MLCKSEGAAADAYKISVSWLRFCYWFFRNVKKIYSPAVQILCVGTSFGSDAEFVCLLLIARMQRPYLKGSTAATIWTSNSSASLPLIISSFSTKYAHTVSVWLLS